MNNERFSEKKTSQYIPLSVDMKEGFAVLGIGLGFLLFFIFIMGLLMGPDPEELS